MIVFVGGDLFERLSAPDYHLTEEKCQLFIRQIMQGLDFIHSNNIIHLDIKPFNILFSNKAGVTHDNNCHIQQILTSTEH